MNPTTARREEIGPLDLEWRVCSVQPGASGGVVAWLAVSPVADVESSAVGNGVLTLEETSVVARLRAKNSGERPALLPGDWIFDGGKQARVIERSVVLAPSSEVDVRVRCVEAGRWAHRTAADEGTFLSRGPANTSTRRSFVRTRERSATDQGEYRLDQREVWNTVESDLDRSGCRSRTSSYVTTLSGTRQHARVNVPWDANGVLALDGRGHGWLEVLPSVEHLAAAATTIIGSAELLPLGPALEETSSPWIDRVMASLWRAELEALATPFGTLGDHARLRARDLGGVRVMLGGAVAHLALGVELRA